MLTIVLVVMVHSCVTYSHVGSWYYLSEPEPGFVQKLPFAVFEAMSQSFFMGLLFFFAGYFSDRSLARRGKAAFLAERLRRLGIPTLLFMVVIHPFVIWGLLREGGTPFWPAYLEFLESGRFLSGSGPMWFCFALLLFSVPFAFWTPKSKSQTGKGVEINAWAVLLLGLGLGIASFLIRIVQPIGTSIMNFQLCFFAQYLVAFPLGVWVSRRNGLNDIAASKTARTAGWTALLLGPAALIGIAIFGGLSNAVSQRIFGGWNASAFAYALWEQFTGIGLGLGAMALCWRLFNRKSSALGWLSDHSFGVYMLHTPVLVALALGMVGLHLPPLMMAAILATSGLILSFGVAAIAKKTPLLKAIL
jgi:peptidoglycan/LPS O-acetylase OafA/YrhL